MFRSITVAVSLSIVAACSSDRASGPDILVSVCEMNGSAGTVTDIRLADLASHKTHGDYIATMIVDPASTVGDGIHFRRVTDALDAARSGRISRSELTSAACRITIQVAPGTFKGSVAASTDPLMERYPIVIDVPDITLKGAANMMLDGADRATGAAEGNATTILTASPALIVEDGKGGTIANLSEPLIIVNAHPQGSSGDGAVIQGFFFQAGRAASDTATGGQGILTMRVKGLSFVGNRFEGGFTEAVDLRASSANVEKNYVVGHGNTCDICLAGPGDYAARDNHLEGPGGIPGILVVPATLIPVPSIVEQYVLPSASKVTAKITNNEVRNHRAKPVGVGLRVAAIGVGAPTVSGTSNVVIVGNNLVNNTFGMIFEAGFPVASGSLKGDISVAIVGNTISQSCQNDLFVSFSRHTTGLGLSNLPYLRNTNYVLALGSDVDWSKAWYAHPAGLGNSLIVSDVTIANGTRQSYDAAKVCP